MKRYYFDWAATSIPDNTERALPEGRGEGGKIHWGNPSSKHSEGRAAREALEYAREHCAAALGVSPGQLYWTSGGTESNAIVLYSYLKHFSQMSGALLAGMTEHPSIMENCKTIKDFGAAVRFINVERRGAVTVDTLTKALEKQKNTGMVSVMQVNNETGAIADIPALADSIQQQATAGVGAGRRIFFHSDMVQALGKIPLSLSACDAASFSAHKIGGPRGGGLLYLKKPIDVLISGGKQERGIRSGTENTAAACRFAECIEQCIPRLAENYRCAAERMAFLIASLRNTGRCSIIPETRTEADAGFSPYILQCAFDKIPGEVMVRSLDDAGFAVSTGSACSSSAKKRPVLDAMGVDPQTAFNAIRISQGWSTSRNDIEALLNAIKEILLRL
ncbi:MAG: cysteine desulfurase [Spirochaetaceae bacterium]|nr:cysteine desulfurase [Spirochaetaceae bacterium]